LRLSELYPTNRECALSSPKVRRIEQTQMQKIHRSEMQPSSFPPVCTRSAKILHDLARTVYFLIRQLRSLSVPMDKMRRRSCF
jgi:hypothetical protein